MTPQEILKGIRYRLNNLEKGLVVLNDSPDGVANVIDDYESRINELRSLYLYIYENVSESQASQKRQLTKKKRVKRSK